MGKKQSEEASSKISKKEKKQEMISSWIKVLRPKVYITDSSSFKKLVQQLTGNGTSQTVDKITVTRSDSSNSIHEDPAETDISSSFDYSFDEFGFGNQQLVSFPEEINQSYDDQFKYLDLTATSVDDYLWMNQLDMDIDRRPNLYGCFSQIYQDEVSIYDYELSGLL
ncbi:hypothetical protein JCGZ_07624 [Jatropha curcas]|uniref:VQ domain-containing protein n=1 Tax=Jatropha curcas TaxID=180498 RepID=A0A067KGB3_JATCU|nr:hypothetical protein JCGZ_07624 [Jatropha curcas]